MAFDVAALDRVADRFLNIVFDPAGWTPALEALQDAAGSSGVVVVCKDRVGWLSGPYPHTENYAELMRTYVDNGLGRIDDRFRGTAALIERGIFTDDDCLSPELRRRSPYYQDFVVPGRLEGFVGLGLNIGGHLSCASIHRDRGEPFSAAEQAHLLRVAPRISMALSIAGQIERNRLDGLGDALETMATPAFLLGQDGTVLRANGGGARLTGQGLALRHGRLTAAGPDNDRLQALIGRVLGARDLASSWSGRPVAIRRQNGRPLLVRAQRLATVTALHYFARATAIVTVTDPDRKPMPTAETLKALFGLTDKEAQVVLVLAAHDGDGVATAEEIGIAYETLRSHLKSVHTKTGTRGITALVTLATRLAATGREAG